MNFSISSTRQLVLSASVALLGAAAFAACEQCDCATAGLQLTIPHDLAADLAMIRVSGPGCLGATVHCASASTACEAFQVDGVDAGICHIEVDFHSTATVTGDVLLQGGTASCCPAVHGFFAVPEPGASSDAGTRD